MTTVPQLTQTVQTLFTTTADHLARRTGFVQRRSKLSGALFAQALVFGWLANAQASLENLAQAAAAVGVAISAQGLFGSVNRPQLDRKRQHKVAPP